MVKAIDRRDFVLWTGAPLLAFSALGVWAVAEILYGPPGRETPLWLAAGLALVGSGVFIAQATASSYIGVVTSEDRGLAVGLYSSAYYVGGTLGGSLPSLFWASGGWMACVLLVILVQAITLVTALGFWRQGST